MSSTKEEIRERNIFGEDLKGYSAPSRNKNMVSGGDYDKHVLVCTDRRKNGCFQHGGFEIKKKFFGLIDREGMDNIKVSSVRSMGFCERGPVAVVYPDGVWYDDLNPDKVPRIVDEHLAGGTPVDELTFDPGHPEDMSHLFVCTFLSACGPEGAGKALRKFRQRAREEEEEKIKITQSYGCLKECSMGPVCCSYPEGEWYAHVHEYKTDDIWEHLSEGTPTSYSVGKIGSND